MNPVFRTRHASVMLRCSITCRSQHMRSKFCTGHGAKALTTPHAVLRARPSNRKIMLALSPRMHNASTAIRIAAPVHLAGRRQRYASACMRFLVSTSASCLRISAACFARNCSPSCSDCMASACGSRVVLSTELELTCRQVRFGSCSGGYRSNRVRVLRIRFSISSGLGSFCKIEWSMSDSSSSISNSSVFLVMIICEKMLAGILPHKSKWR